MNYLLLTVLFAAASLGFGCASSSPESTPAETTAPRKFSVNDEKAGKILAEKYIKALALAIQKHDFKEIAPFLNSNVSTARQKRSIFEQLCNRLAKNGTLVSTVFVTEIDQTLCRDYIWKLDFEKKTSSEKLPMIKTSMLYSIRIVITDGKPEIIGSRLIQL